LDFFSGCRLELTAPRSAVRQNRKIGRGSVVVQTTKEFTPAKVLITAVVFLVPSKAQYELRRQVKDVCRACIKDVVNNPNMQQHVAKQTWGLLLARLSYSAAECARSEEWFGRFKNARVISVKFSLALFRLFAALSSTTMNVKKRQRKFEKACKWAEYPRKLREWLLQTWGPGFQACFVDCDADEDLSEWTLGLAKSRADDQGAEGRGAEDRVAGQTEALEQGASSSTADVGSGNISRRSRSASAGYRPVPRIDAGNLTAPGNEGAPAGQGRWPAVWVQHTDDEGAFWRLEGERNVSRRSRAPRGSRSRSPRVRRSRRRSRSPRVRRSRRRSRSRRSRSPRGRRT